MLPLRIRHAAGALTQPTSANLGVFVHSVFLLLLLLPWLLGICLLAKTELFLASFLENDASEYGRLAFLFAVVGAAHRVFSFVCECLNEQEDVEGGRMVEIVLFWGSLAMLVANGICAGYGVVAVAMGWE